MSGGKFYIDGTQQATLSLEPGITYKFDQSDASNSSHPLRFSTTSDGTHNSGSEYTTGVTTNGTAGSSGAYTEIAVTYATPSLYYYCTNHSGMGAGSVVGNSAGYTNSDVDAHLNQSSATTGQVLSWNGSDYNWTSAYAHPNHTGEVTSTGDGATVIADNVVDEANLKVSNSPTDGYVLTARSGNTGGMTWEAASGGGGGGIALTDLSVTQNSASGSGSLTYNNTSGVFSYTPPASTGGGGGSSTSALTETTFSASGNQTAFVVSGGITNAANVSVFQNGVKLEEGATEDYTVNASTNTVTLNSGAAAGDVVEVLEYGQSSLAVTDLTDTPSSLGSAGQVLQVNSGATALEFADASSGSGVTVYTGLSGTDGTPANATYLLNASNPSAGDLAYVTANTSLYQNNGNGWYRIAVINTTPTISSVADASSNTTPFSLTGGTNTVITVTAADVDEGTDLTYSHSVTSGSLNGTTVTQGTGASENVFTIAPHASNAATFSITFTVSDSINAATSVAAFTLAFSVTDSHYTSLLIATDGSAGDNNDITDSSSNSYTITASGDAHAGTFSPYRDGGYSSYFDGSGDYLSISSSSDFNIGADATFECWCYPTATATASPGDLLLLVYGGSNNTAWLSYTGASKFEFRLGYTGSWAQTLTSTNTFGLNQWYHVVGVRSSGTSYLFVNGVQEASGSNSTDLSALGNSVYVGSQGTVRQFQGYISDARIVNGTAIYTSAFTPPTERLTAVTNTKLLTCHLPYFKDGSSNDHSITVNGDPETKPFGPYDYQAYSKSTNGGSIHFDGTGDYLTVYDTGLSVGNNSAFTVEFWFLTSKDPDALQNIWNTYSSSTASMTDEQLKFAYNNQNTGAIYLYDRQNSGNILEVTNKKLGRNTWNHFCWTRDASNNHKFYINGEQIGTSTSSTSYDTNRMAFGVREYNTANAPLDGNISDFRLVKGTVVYSGEFTPPTGPLTTTGGTYSDTTNVNTSITSGHTKLLISGTDAHVIDKSQVSNLKLGGTAAAVTNAPNNSNISSTNAVSLDGDSDYVQLPVGSLDLGSSDFTLEAWIYQDTNAGSGSSSHTIYSDWLNTNNNKSSLFRVTDSSGQKVQFLYSTDGSASTNYTSTATISNSTWTHVAVCKDSTSLRFYKDGAREVWASSPSFTLNPNDGTVGPLIGSNYDGAGVSYTQFFDGYIQDFRVTKGKARYTAADESSNIPSAPLSA